MTIEYYISLNSPWTWLGHDRFIALAAEHRQAIHVEPVDYGVIFPATGGLPLPKRSPQRRAYRLQELERWSSWLDVPIVFEPKHWPGDELPGAGAIHVARERGLDAVALAGAILRANWVEERDIGDRGTIVDVAAPLDMDGAELLAAADAMDYPAHRRAASQAAIERGVFGAPTYIVGDAIFWGQDRLDFLQRELEQHGSTVG